jgi:hypothetical protein
MKAQTKADSVAAIEVRIDSFPFEQRSINLIFFLSPPFSSRAARWYIFKPKILILVNFGESCNG